MVILHTQYPLTKDIAVDPQVHDLSIPQNVNVDQWSLGQLMGYQQPPHSLQSNPPLAQIDTAVHSLQKDVHRL